MNARKYLALVLAVGLAVVLGVLVSATRTRPVGQTTSRNTADVPVPPAVGRHEADLSSGHTAPDVWSGLVPADTPGDVAPGTGPVDTGAALVDHTAAAHAIPLPAPPVPAPAGTPPNAAWTQRTRATVEIAPDLAVYQPLAAPPEPVNPAGLSPPLWVEPEPMPKEEERTHRQRIARSLEENLDKLAAELSRPGVPEARKQQLRRAVESQTLELQETRLWLTQEH
jgi:hypothetical protein